MRRNDRGKIAQKPGRGKIIQRRACLSGISPDTMGTCAIFRYFSTCPASGAWSWEQAAWDEESSRPWRPAVRRKYWFWTSPDRPAALEDLLGQPGVRFESREFRPGDLEGPVSGLRGHRGSGRQPKGGRPVPETRNPLQRGGRPRGMRFHLPFPFQQRGVDVGGVHRGGPARPWPEKSVWTWKSFLETATTTCWNSWAA